MEGWRNKLQSLIKGPGWRPGSPWTGYITDVPDVINVERKNIYLNFTCLIVTGERTKKIRATSTTLVEKRVRTDSLFHCTIRL